MYFVLEKLINIKYGFFNGVKENEAERKRDEDINAVSNKILN